MWVHYVVYTPEGRRITVFFPFYVLTDHLILPNVLLDAHALHKSHVVSFFVSFLYFSLVPKTICCKYAFRIHTQISFIRVWFTIFTTTISNTLINLVMIFYFFSIEIIFSRLSENKQALIFEFLFIDCNSKVISSRNDVV